MQVSLKQSTDGSGGPDCRETLSCLIDGELDQAECTALFGRISSDPGACAQWALMNAACDALRSSEVAALHSASFVDRVSAALEREPTALAPAALSRRRFQRVVLPGAAIAAAAAVLLFVAVPQLRGSGEPAQVAATPAAPATGNVQAVEVARVPEIERYLRAHRELAGGTVMPQSTPYLRTSNNLPAESH